MWNGTAATSRFEEARPRERELNDRQREILGLIERGHTNREIAEMLGISLDGAKWHVSEILSKLGLSSREEAAEYWRWRQGWAQPLRRLFRAAIGLPAFKWAAGSAAGMVGAAAVVVAVTGGGQEAPAAVPADSFYVEATAHRADPEHPADYVFRWWHYDETQARWEWDKVWPAIETQHQSSVLNGSTLYSYSPDGGNLRIDPAFSNGVKLPRPKDVVLVGPIEQASLQELLTWLSSWGDGKVPAQVTGYERVGTRDTAVITYASGTMWLDTSEMVIVKNESDSTTIELTTLTRAPFARSVVQLPRTAAALPTPTPVDFSNVRLPNFEPVLAPTSQPWPVPELAIRAMGRAGTMSEQILMSQEQFWENQHTPGTPARNGTHILLQQRTDLVAMPEGMRQGAPIPLRGVTAFLTDTPALVVLDWREPDGRLVHMEGVGVSADEVLKVAESLTMSP